MAGIYIHIPFCRQACVYCNFHFSVHLSDITSVAEAICKEIELRKSYLGTSELTTLYFGGGTPSVMPAETLEKIISTVRRHFSLPSDAEITLEANPDDLDNARLSGLREAGINRLSIGVQSFSDADLKWMNRVHNAEQALRSVEDALAMDFLVSIDLIFGSMTTDNATWMNNLKTAHALGVQHLSCYGLTLEERTALQKLVARGKYEKPDENKSAEQFAQAMDYLESNGWEQYEISNYARNGAYAVHNTNYWRNEPYLGIGPSAHSFNGTERGWNVADNKKYTEMLNAGKLVLETERLTTENRFNEYLMTGLRTIWGVSLPLLKQITDPGKTFDLQLEQFIAEGKVIRRGDTIFLSREGKFYADMIAAGLFV